MTGPASARATLGGRTFINFAGSTYLALGRQRELREAAQRALDSDVAFSCQLPAAYGVIDPWIRDAEQAAASFCGTEDAVFLPSGYFIGITALLTLDTSNTVLFIDDSAHFSLFDACQLIERPHVTFRHCDPESLADAIKKQLPARMRPIVVTDGVFATTGRVAPLDRYAAVIERYNGRMAVDEAHAFGVLGTNGRGSAEYHGVESIASCAGTLSKAFCAQGAVIGCRREVADKLRSIPPLRGANAGSPISAAVAAASIRYVQANPDRRARLAELTASLRTRLKGIGLDIADSPAPIVAFQLGSAAAMKALQQRLFERGIYVLVSNYIGAGATGVVRCAVFADHTEADFDALTGAIQEI